MSIDVPFDQPWQGEEGGGGWVVILSERCGRVCLDGEWNRLTVFGGSSNAEVGGPLRYIVYILSDNKPSAPKSGEWGER